MHWQLPEELSFKSCCMSVKFQILLCWNVIKFVNHNIIKLSTSPNLCPRSYNINPVCLLNFKTNTTNGSRAIRAFQPASPLAHKCTVLSFLTSDYFASFARGFYSQYRKLIRFPANSNQITQVWIFLTFD